MDNKNINIQERLKESGIERLELPMPKNSLGHVNVYFIRQNNDVWIIDSGMRAPEHQALIKEKIDGFIADGASIKVLITTHYHPDHIGWTDWIKDYTGCALYMAEKEWFMGRWLAVDHTDDYLKTLYDFYRSHGFSDDVAQMCTDYFEASRQAFPPLPARDKTLAHGDTIALNENNYDIFTVTGHSPEHVCLFDKENNVLFSIDAILQFVTPNVSAWPFAPNDNPLKDFKEHLTVLGNALDENTLVLPGHGKPFLNGAKRAREILKHHDRREEKILDVLNSSDKPLTIADFVTELYNREFSRFDWVFATGEAYSHLNYLENNGKVQRHQSQEKEATITWSPL